MGLFDYIGLVRRIDLVDYIGLFDHIGLVGRTVGFIGLSLAGLSDIINFSDIIGLASRNSLINFIGLDGLVNLIYFAGLVNLIGLVSLVDFIGLVDFISLGGLISHLGLIGNNGFGIMGISLVDVGFFGIYGLTSFVGLSFFGIEDLSLGLISLVGSGYISLYGRIGLIGVIGLIGLVGLIGFSIIAISLGLACIEFEIRMKQS